MALAFFSKSSIVELYCNGCADGDIPHDPNTRTQLFTGNTVRNQDCFTETGNHKSMGKKLVSLIVMKFRDKLEYDNISIVKW